MKKSEDKTDASNELVISQTIRKANGTVAAPSRVQNCWAEKYNIHRNEEKCIVHTILIPR